MRCLDNFLIGNGFTLMEEEMPLVKNGEYFTKLEFDFRRRLYFNYASKISMVVEFDSSKQRITNMELYLRRRGMKITLFMMYTEKPLHDDWIVVNINYEDSSGAISLVCEVNIDGGIEAYMDSRGNEYDKSWGMKLPYHTPENILKDKIEYFVKGH